MRPGAALSFASRRSASSTLPATASAQAHAASASRRSRSRRLLDALEQLERVRAALEHRARDADRAVVGACSPQPRSRELQRLTSRQQRQRPVKRRLGLLAAPPPRLDLAELEPQVGAVGRDRERLLEVADRLLECRQRPGVGGRADELRHGVPVGAGAPQVPRNLVRAPDGAGLL